MELTSRVFKDNYTGYVEGAFDLAISDFATTHIPDFDASKLPAGWKIGVICGASGSGKSSILRSLGEITPPNSIIASQSSVTLRHSNPKMQRNSLRLWGLRVCHLG